MARYIQGLLGAATLTAAMTAMTAMTVMAGCDPAIEEEEAQGEVRDRGLELNSFRLNSFRLNSFRLNGDWLGATSSDDIRLVAAGFPNGPVITDGWLVGSELRVLTELGEEVAGAQVGGAELVFDVMQDGVLTQGVHARLVSAKPMVWRPGVWLYNFEVEEKGVWQPLCVDPNDVGTQAILLADLWDEESGAQVSPRPSGAITVACRGAALAKCVEWGYRPWDTRSGVSLHAYHQACTRAVRADYCGDGTPHTKNGTQIHVKDPLGVQKADPNKPYGVEAEWGPDGALCLNDENTRLADAQVACDLPACSAELLDKGLLQTGKPVGP